MAMPVVVPMVVVSMVVMSTELQKRQVGFLAVVQLINIILMCLCMNLCHLLVMAAVVVVVSRQGLANHRPDGAGGHCGRRRRHADTASSSWLKVQYLS